jgi:hypothetical protein
MKMLLFLVLLLTFSGFCILKAGAENQIINKTTLSGMIKKENETVKSINSYKFTIIWVDRKPLIQIDQVVINFVDKKNDIRNILLVNPQQSLAEENKTISALDEFKNFKAVKVNQLDGGNLNDENDSTLLKYEIFDMDNRIRMEQWRYLNNGFPVEQIIFGKDKSILSLIYKTCQKTPGF